MYLSKIQLTWQQTQNSYQWHRALWQLFPNKPASARDFLFHIEQISVGVGALCLLQSASKPISNSASQVLISKSINLLLPDSGALKFRLRANPVKCIQDGLGRRNSKGQIKSCRVPLIDETEQQAWLQRKLDGAASIISLRITPELGMDFRKGNIHGKIQPILYEGTLDIQQQDLLQQLIMVGIGPGKAFGCGLLSLANV